MTTPADIFIDVLREARIKRGLSIEEVAKLANIEAHALKRWERGEQKPRLPSAFKVAAILGFRFELVAAK